MQGPKMWPNASWLIGQLKASEFVTSLQGGQRQHILGFSSCYCWLAAEEKRRVKQVKVVL